MKISHAGLTDVGRKRDHNEDNLLMQPDDGLFVVCDGMGGHACGEVASQLACDKISEFFDLAGNDEDVTWPYKDDKKLSEAENMIAIGIKWANFSVFEKASSSIKHKGMGTTCVSVYFMNSECAIAHVGDSRCYRIRDDEIDQVTEDHSLLNDYKKLAKLTPDEIKNFPHKNIITRALGMKPSVAVETRLEKLRKGDTYLLCCDGLSGELDSGDMLEIVLNADGDLDTASRDLVDQANKNGGRDNITVILVSAG